MGGDVAMASIFKHLGKAVRSTQDVRSVLSKVEDDLRSQGILKDDEEINISFVKRKGGSAKKGGGVTKKGGIK